MYRTIFKAMATALILYCLAAARIIHVPTDYVTIQAGVNTAHNGDTVLVADGLYHEHVVIPSAILLKGESREGTIIDGSDSGTVVTLEASHITLSDFTIRNCGNSAYWDAGIGICGREGCKVERCIFTDNNNGFRHYNSRYDTVSCCLFDGNTRGIYFWAEHDSLPESVENIIANNIFVNSTSYGIEFEHLGLGWYYMFNIIRGNRFETNVAGLRLITSHHNLIHGNDYLFNAGYAMEMIMCGCGGDNNMIYANNFIENNVDTLRQCTNYLGMIPWQNIWWNYYTGRGNYWSDYAGQDLNRDGIGDTPQLLDGGDDACDSFPVMAQIHPAIRGTVRDLAMNPLIGVAIWPDSQTSPTYSGVEGDYRIENVRAGYGSIRFYLDGYRDTTVFFVPATNGDTTLLDVNMTPSTGTRNDDFGIPRTISLGQNIPNPFNAGTILRVRLDEKSRARLVIYNIIGQVVDVPIDAEFEAGDYRVVWDAAGLPSGVYFARLEARGQARTIKMILEK